MQAFPRRIKLVSGLKRLLWCEFLFEQFKCRICEQLWHFVNISKISKLLENLNASFLASNNIGFLDSKQLPWCKHLFQKLKNRIFKTFEKLSNFRTFWNRLNSEMQASLCRIILVSGIEQFLWCKHPSQKLKNDLWNIVTFLWILERFRIVWTLKCKLACAESYRFLVSANYFDIKIFFKDWKTGFFKNCEILPNIWTP